MKKLIIKTILLLNALLFGAGLSAQEIIVLNGLDDTINWLEAENWWGPENHEEQLTVPRALMTSIGPNWRKAAPDLPVATKKELFYRFMLPLVMHANTMIMDRCERLEGISEKISKGDTLSPEDLEALVAATTILRISTADPVSNSADDPVELQRIINEALYKLDIIPAGLALGQGAYESGYGTSRFAAEGNALFGQWTFGGEGLVPEQQRTEEHGDHRIAAYEWPFDSVRAYFINLMSHPAYEDFRAIRAEMRRNGEQLDSMKLAEGLTSYSERGHEYVETLQGIMRVNKLTIADNAVFRDEPLRFIVSAENPGDVDKIHAEIEKMRASGELAEILERMNLE